MLSIIAVLLPAAVDFLDSSFAIPLYIAGLFLAYIVVRGDSNWEFIFIFPALYLCLGHLLLLNESGWHNTESATYIYTILLLMLAYYSKLTKKK